jgi:hypothetical protein
MAKLPKPDADLAIYVVTLNGAFDVWRAARGAVQGALTHEADDDEVIFHFEYLAVVRNAIARLHVPAGGEHAQRALVSIIDTQIDAYRHYIFDEAAEDEADDDADTEQRVADSAEDFRVFEYELSQLASQATGGLLK